jgi:hypothetical protein
MIRRTVTSLLSCFGINDSRHCAGFCYGRAFVFCMILLWSLCFGIPVFAKGSGGIEANYSALITGTSSTANSTALDIGSSISLSYPNANEVSKEIKNVITLSVFEETSSYLPSNFTASVRVKIEYGHSSSSFTEKEQVFAVTYNKGEGEKYDAKNYLVFDNAEFVRLTVLQITAPGLGNLDIRQVLRLQNEMRVMRYYELSNGITPSNFPNENPTSDALNISWSWPANGGNNYTEIEWTWVEDELSSGVTDVDLLFKNNATRVDIPLAQTSYGIPLFYDGQGKLYYRIRAVNMKSTGARSDGAWVGFTSMQFWRA